MTVSLDADADAGSDRGADASSSDRPPRWTWALWSAGAVLVALLALPVPLIAPPPAEGTYLCGEFREVLDGHGYVKNCDSVAFWSLARDPGAILDNGNPRQSRPLFVALGTISRAVVKPFVGLAGEEAADGTAPAQAGYLALNVTLLALAVGLAGRLLRSVRTPWPIVAAVFGVLVVNNIIKAFIWTAHTQLFNLLLPIVLVAIVARTVNADFPQRRRFLVALALGVAVLAYGTFLVGLPLLLVSGEISRRRSGEPADRSLLVREAALSAVFVAPTVLWVAFVAIVSDGFYSHETAEYRQFVWVFDAAESGFGEVVSQAATFTGEFGGTLPSIEIGTFILLFAVALGSFVIRRRSSTPSAREGDLQIASLLTAGGLVLFLWPVGFYAERMSFTIVPALLIFIALEGGARWKESAWVPSAPLFIAVASWVTLHLVRAGPYN